MLISVILSSLISAFCTPSEREFNSELSRMLDVGDTLPLSAVPYTDVGFDDSDLFPALAHPDSGTHPQGATWMWDINPSRVLVLRAYSGKEGEACVDQYTGLVTMYYADPFRLPSVERETQIVSE